MQRQWTVEARADFADPGKNELIANEVRAAAVNLNAKLQLIKDNGMAPKVVCFSDDFFTGHVEIGLLEDTMGKAITEANIGVAEPLSDELRELASELHSDANNKK